MLMQQIRFNPTQETTDQVIWLWRQCGDDALYAQSICVRWPHLNDGYEEVALCEYIYEDYCSCTEIYYTYDEDNHDNALIHLCYEHADENYDLKVYVKFV